MPVTWGAACRKPRVRFGLIAGVGRDDDRGQPAEWREQRLFALADLAIVKSLRIAGDDGLHNRMRRLIGLDQAMALQARAPGAARHLREQLEGALRRARIAVRQTKIRIDDPDQRHQREIVPLGDELRADDDIRLAARDGLQLQSEPLDAHQIGGKHDGARLGKMFFHLLGDTLHPGPQAARWSKVPHSGQASGVRSA